MFSVVNSKGFTMRFANNWEISVMFGEGNYCSNKMGVSPVKRNGFDMVFSTSAEVAIFNDKGRMQDWPPFLHNDTVLGWCDADKVASIILWVSQQ